ncbi:hypothetical protein N6H18_14385 [Reichenbachiella agarivorans]|uniref:Phosphoribosylanthranilate isomerase n=1 Tax=Reichenbachiella agarivorans TaxID=2979464 RepID=A0ABY6CM11_9BACT|nr:hypothetical protein [Reichenbachiella agarivorans]UXP31536.1 hypothetical protein N6H18_14385 [Reichenbachiella agarivorans]
MNLKTFVKVGNVSNLSDARYCAGFGVNMIGFNLDSNQEDAIDTTTAHEIMGWVAGVDFVMEYGSMALDQIDAVHDSENPAYIQVDTVAVANQLTELSYKVIFRLTESHIDQTGLLDQLSPQVKFVLVESESDYDHIKSQIGSIKILRGYDLTPDNIGEIVDTAAYYGIGLLGSHEEKPGFKDYDELADILEVLEID